MPFRFRIAAADGSEGTRPCAAMPACAPAVSRDRADPGPGVVDGGVEAARVALGATCSVAAVAVARLRVRIQQSSRDHQPEDDHRLEGEASAQRRSSSARGRRPAAAPLTARAILRRLVLGTSRSLRRVPLISAPRFAPIAEGEEAPPPCEVARPASPPPWGGPPGAADAPGFPGREPCAAGPSVGLLIMVSSFTCLARVSAGATQVISPEPPSTLPSLAVQEEKVGEQNHDHDDILAVDARAAAKIAVIHQVGVVVNVRKREGATLVIGSSSAALRPWCWPPPPSAAASRAKSASRAAASAGHRPPTRLVPSAALVDAPAAHSPPISRVTHTARAEGSVASGNAGWGRGELGVDATVLNPCGVD